VNPSPARLAHAVAVAGELLRHSGPADLALSAYFRRHRDLGPRDRAFVAETAYAVLRRRRSLEAAAGSAAPRDLVLAALVKVFGLSGRALGDEGTLVARMRSVSSASLAPAVQAELPDWLWERLVAQQGADEALRIARGMLNPAPLDLRVNLAKISREEALAGLKPGAASTPYSPCGIRLEGKPRINAHPLFRSGAIEVQDEGSQLLAYLVGPQRGERVADYCAGAGGKTLALAMLMRGTGRIYAMDVSAKRLAALAPRAARAGISNVHAIALSGENDARAKRLAGKIDRVLVDAPCSGFGTLRRNPDLKWRYGPERIAALAGEQLRILRAASRLVKPGGRLVYATCSILREENDEVVDRFVNETGGFALLSCDEILERRKIPLRTGTHLRLWPHVHATDGFFAAAFERVN
jgi:16S rRNA (cytosine967-C5)-methyltransferase